MGKSEKKALVQVLRHLSNDGVHALFLPFAEEDIRICSELSESVAGSVSLTCVPTAKEASLAISCSRGCIGARLHSAILSLVCKRAFVGFDSDGRILRINGHAGTGEYVPASKLSEKSLLDAWAAAQKFDVSLADEALLRMRSLASGELDTLQTFFEKRSKENQG